MARPGGGRAKMADNGRHFQRWIVIVVQSVIRYNTGTTRIQNLHTHNIMHICVYWSVRRTLDVWDRQRKWGKWLVIEMLPILVAIYVYNYVHKYILNIVLFTKVIWRASIYNGPLPSLRLFLFYNRDNLKRLKLYFA